jgi:hypothetical protein
MQGEGHDVKFDVMVWCLLSNKGQRKLNYGGWCNCETRLHDGPNK